MSKPELFLTPGYGEELHELLHYSQALKIGDRWPAAGFLDTELRCFQ